MDFLKCEYTCYSKIKNKYLKFLYLFIYISPLKDKKNFSLNNSILKEALYEEFNPKNFSYGSYTRTNRMESCINDHIRKFSSSLRSKILHSALPFS